MAIQHPPPPSPSGRSPPATAPAAGTHAPAPGSAAAAPPVTLGKSLRLRQADPYGPRQHLAAKAPQLCRRAPPSPRRPGTPSCRGTQPPTSGARRPAARLVLGSGTLLSPWRQSCSEESQPSCGSRWGLGSLHGRGSDEHSLSPSTMSRISCSSDKRTRTAGAQSKRSAISGGCRAPACPNATVPLQARSSQLLLPLLLYHNALGLAFTLLKEHEYIIIHTKEQVIVYELPAFPGTKAIFIRKLNFILAPI